MHQFHPSIAYGDAVTNSLLLTQELLHDLGFASEIYVDRGDPRIDRPVRPLREFEPSSDGVLLVHHSLGHDFVDWVLGFPGRKILVYHNITPAAFFPDDAFLRTHAELGREQLRRYRDHVVASFCDSPYNAAELLDLGYRDVSVVPLLLDTNRLRQAPWNPAIVDANAALHTTLFVGRVERNKCTHDVVDVFRHVRRWIDRPCQLVLAGSYNPHAAYVHEVRDRIARLGLADDVQLLGHVADADLRAWYRAADVFVSMSEHEGFGVPLVEAMTFGVPVIAHASSNVPNTLGSAGILVEGKPHEEVGALVRLLATDHALRRRVVRRQRERSAEFSARRIRSQLAEALARVGLPVTVAVETISAPTPAVEIQIEGSFESSYSLALVNRELAIALDTAAPGSVALFPTEGYGDYEPDRAAIAAMPTVERLWQRGRKGSMADVVLRNMYPPRVADMDGTTNLLNFFWEESGLPHEWAEAFNRHLDGICVASRYVKKVLVDAGVYVPIHVVGAGIEHVLREGPRPHPGPLGRAFRFLNVSSAFPRKGLDVLLAAYAASFTDADDVSLVLKTFPNPHNETARQIDTLRRAHPYCPDIVHIDRDLPAAELVDVYRRCHAFVAPTRGEGFGLPMAEAMLLGVPVVTTAFGGHRDFCTDDVCWPVGFAFARSRSHLAPFDSLWVEPNAGDLARAMRDVFEASPSQRRGVAQRAAAVVSRDYTWAGTAARVRTAVAALDATPPLANARIPLGWVTTWNSKCGIARYSAFLLERMPPDGIDVTILASRRDVVVEGDAANVHRCWDDASIPDLSELRALVAAEGLRALVVQFNFGLFATDALGALLDDCAARGIVTIVVFHSTRDGGYDSLRRIAPTLARADRLLVHSLGDLNRLRAFDVFDNTTLFPQGVIDHVATDKTAARARLGLDPTRRVIASYGFLLQHKGVEQLVEAFPAVLCAHPDTTLLLVNALYPIPESAALRRRCEALVDELGLRDRVRIVTDFLANEESLRLLECADVVVYPYQRTDESSSAAVRFGLASGRPVACTPLSIFDDVADVVHFLPGPTPAEIADGLVTLLSDPAELANRANSQAEWLRTHAWSVVARRLAGMVRALVADRAARPGALTVRPSPQSHDEETDVHDRRRSTRR